MRRLAPTRYSANKFAQSIRIGWYGTNGFGLSKTKTPEPPTHPTEKGRHSLPHISLDDRNIVGPHNPQPTVCGYCATTYGAGTNHTGQPFDLHCFNEAGRMAGGFASDEAHNYFFCTRAIALLRELPETRVQYLELAS